jgi:UDP-2-acetamido-3-amino-2,3-dideoxy-glucuronate N-acetyltransferase
MISEYAEVSPFAHIGGEVIVWEFSKIRENSIIGSRTIIGRNVYVGPGVEVGCDCKIQNAALIYEPAIIGNKVFIGPGVIMTNDLNPRATNVTGIRKTESEWKKERVIVSEGASLGAGAICVAPVTLGKWCMVGAGSIVLRDVPDFALVVGAPAKQIGWVGHAGMRLTKIKDGVFECPVTGQKFYEGRDGLYTDEFMSHYE